MTKDEKQFALVTGANGGIGQALCKTFKEEGYEVIATDVHDKPLDSLTFSQYVSIDLNKLVESESYAADRTNQIKSFLSNGELHALINNAAIQILGGVDSLTRSDWSQTLNINLQAPFLLAQAFISELEVCKGSIVNISSIHAKLTKKNFVAYATSKAALSGMTRAMAVDLGSRIKVNAIEPAAVETQMLRDGFKSSPELFQLLKNYHPTKCIAQPNDVCRAVQFLIKSGSFGSGMILAIDGAIGASLHDPSFEE